MRIRPVTVPALKLAVLAVDEKLRTLVATDYASGIYSFLLRVEVTAASGGAIFFDIPTPLRIGHYVMGTMRFSHVETP